MILKLVCLHAQPVVHPHHNAPAPEHHQPYLNVFNIPRRIAMHAPLYPAPRTPKPNRQNSHLDVPAQ